jgi:hypothetical protein
MSRPLVLYNLRSANQGRWIQRLNGGPAVDEVVWGVDVSARM